MGFFFFFWFVCLLLLLLVGFLKIVLAFFRDGGRVRMCVDGFSFCFLFVSGFFFFVFVFVFFFFFVVFISLTKNRASCFKIQILITMPRNGQRRIRGIFFFLKLDAHRGVKKKRLNAILQQKRSEYGCILNAFLNNP